MSNNDLDACHYLYNDTSHTSMFVKPVLLEQQQIRQHVPAALTDVTNEYITITKSLHLTQVQLSGQLKKILCAC